MLGKLGIPVTCSDIFGVAGSAWLDQLGLPQPYAGKVTPLRQLIAGLEAEISMLSDVIAGLLAGDHGYRVIQQLPGIGPVLTAVIEAEIGDVRRFKTSAQLCCWAGLTPRHRPMQPGHGWDMRRDDCGQRHCPHRYTRPLTRPRSFRDDRPTSCNRLRTPGEGSAPGKTAASAGFLPLTSESTLRGWLPP